MSDWQVGSWGDRPALIRDLFTVSGEAVGREVFQLDENEVCYWREWDQDEPRRTTAGGSLARALAEAPEHRERILEAAKRSIERTRRAVVRRLRKTATAVERGDWDEASKLDDEPPHVYSGDDLRREVEEAEAS